MSKWQKVKLGDICDILDSYRVPITAKNREVGIYPYYGANGIQDYVKDFIFDGDYVLVAEDGGYFGSKTKPISYKVSGKFWVNNHAHILKAKKDIFTDYLCYSTMFYDVSSLVNGATCQKLTQAALKEIKIPLPPMEEQKKIAARLDAVSDLLAKQKQLLSEQDNLIQSTFYDMFGDPIKNNKGWKIEKLGNLFSVSSGGTPDTKNKEYWENGDISWIGSNLCQNVILTKNDGKFITQKGLENSSAKIISAGSVLIALVGATIGKTALLTFETTTNQNIAAIDVVKNDNFSSYFIFYLIQALYQEFLNIGSGKFKMANLTFVRNLKIPIPPLELQEKFATIVKQIESEKSKIKSAIAETQTLFNALMAEYFEE